MARVANMPSTCNGLEIWSFMPQASARSRSVSLRKTWMCRWSGGTVTKITTEKRKALLDSVVGKWTGEVDAGCGPELAGKVRALFKQHSL